MWGVLRMLVFHNGSLRAAGRPLKGKADDASGVCLPPKHACPVDCRLLSAFHLQASWHAGSNEARLQSATSEKSLMPVSALVCQFYRIL